MVMANILSSSGDGANRPPRSPYIAKQGRGRIGWTPSGAAPLEQQKGRPRRCGPSGVFGRSASWREHGPTWQPCQRMEGLKIPAGVESGKKRPPSETSPKATRGPDVQQYVDYLPVGAALGAGRMTGRASTTPFQGARRRISCGPAGSGVAFWTT